MNADQCQIVERLVKQLDTKKKELSDFQEKYKIRIKVGFTANDNCAHWMLSLLVLVCRGLPSCGVFTGRGRGAGAAEREEQ